MAQEHLTLGDADHEQTLSFRLNTRTGGFSLNDPELIDQLDVTSVQADIGTSIGLTPLNPVIGQLHRGEPFLYVAPRLFFRFTNNGDQQMDASDFAIRIASISRRLSFRLFIELLERFADVTLL